jgi:predicted 3-demethylubiquinone-9 3-methyltransferase (glyoxalase superfamily)
MFQGDCEAAIRLYTETIPDSEIQILTHWEAGGNGIEGQVQMSTFRIGQTVVMAFDSPPVHQFTFTPASSLWLDCESVDDYERVLEGLGTDGVFLMPDDSYGFSKRYAWLQDRYGVAWQVNLK